MLNWYGPYNPGQAVVIQRDGHAAQGHEQGQEKRIKLLHELFRFARGRHRLERSRGVREKLI